MQRFLHPAVCVVPARQGFSAQSFSQCAGGKHGRRNVLDCYAHAHTHTHTQRNNINQKNYTHVGTLSLANLRSAFKCNFFYFAIVKGKGKAVPLLAWTGLERS